MITPSSIGPSSRAATLAATVFACVAGLWGCAARPAPACPAPHTSLELAASVSEPRPNKPAAQETREDVGRPEPTSASANANANASPFADISLLVAGKLVTFSSACRGFSGGDGTASAGAHLSPGRAPWTWLRGCDGSHATFYAGMTRTPVVGVAVATIFDLTLPGMKPQKLDESGIFEITSVTAERIAGKFEVDVRTAEGGPLVHARGTFDLPRAPDDTSRGP